MEGDITRRELFKKFIPQSHSEKMEDANTQQAKNRVESQFEKEDISRRKFLKLAGVLGASIAFGLKLSKAEGREIDKKDTTHESSDKQEVEEYGKSVAKKYEPITKEQESKLETFIESSFLEIGKLTAMDMFRKFGFKNIPTIDDLRENIKEQSKIQKIFEMVVDGVIIAPYIEEGLFRFFPSEVLVGRKGINSRKRRWDVGIPVALLFALSHNIKRDYIQNKLEVLSFEKQIPLPQFISGIFYWYMMREKGFSHAVFAHRSTNADAYIIAELLNQAYPVKKEDDNKNS